MPRRRSRPRRPSRLHRQPQLQRNPRPCHRPQSRACTAGGSGRPGRSPERRTQNRAAGLHPQRFRGALFLDRGEQPGNSVVPERQCGRSLRLIAKPRCKHLTAAAAPPPAEPARQAAPAKKPAEPKPAEPARAAPRLPRPPPLGGDGGADGAAESCHPRRVPLRFRVALLRRAARRRRSVAMSQKQRGAALGRVPQRRGRDRRWRRRRGGRSRPERRLLLRRQRSHQSGQCRCCARATRWRSCKSAALKCGRSAPAFRSAAAVSSVASPQTHRACRRAVTAR